MRIAYVALSARGGTSLYSTALASRIGQVSPVLYIGPSHLPEKDRPKGVDYFSVSTGYTHREGLLRSFMPGSYIGIAKAIREFQPDLIHFPLSHPWNLIVALICGAVPIVFTVHDPAPHPGAKLPLVTEVMHQLLYRRASRLIVLCQYSRSLLPAAFRARTEVIFHPAFEHYRIGVRASKQRRPCAVLFGRMEPYKGVNVFCEAAAQLSAEGIDADFIIAGPGRLSKCLDAPPPAAVTVINRLLSEQEVSELLADASVMVLPYTEATQSGVLAAAYALGVPVVATTVGSFPEFIREGESGIMVAPNDPVALAAAIRRVLDDSEFRERLSRGADKLGRTLFSWSEVVTRHRDLYSGLVGDA